MSFADPQSITINGVATSLPRVASGVNNGKYTSNDGLISLSASHNYGKRTRRIIRVDQAKVAASPFDASLNQKYSMSTYLVVDIPETGYTVAELQYIITGFITALTASSNALTTKFLGGES